MGVRRRLSCAVAIAGTLGTPAIAADQLLPAVPPLATKVPPSLLVKQPIPSAQMEFALRFWYGNAKTSKSLFAPPSISDQMVSRLTYSGLNTYSGELHARQRAPFFGLLKFAGIRSWRRGAS